MKNYSLASAPFRTIQGEGLNAGRCALFVRFAGCNLWTGLDRTRDRDAERHDVECPRWCDTDFRPTQRPALHELVALIRDHADAGLVVFTGGEPLMQLDLELVSTVKDACPTLELAVETNGTRAFDPGVEALISHVCVSPKVGPERMKLRRGTELKVVVPAYDPEPFDTACDALGTLFFKALFVSPEAHPTNGIQQPAVDEAVQWVINHPRWRLSFQLHKAIGVP